MALKRFIDVNYLIQTNLRRLYSSREQLQLDIPFAKAKIGTFFQKQPQLENQYLMDVTLRRYLQRIMPQEILTAIEPDLILFGQRVTEDIYEYGMDCERNPPKLIHNDAWGNRIDKIITAEGWRKLKDISAEEGIIAIGYDRTKFGEWSRLYQMVKLNLFAVSSGLYSSPIAMTDGAAKTLECLNLNELNNSFQRLISRDPKSFWTSGQWMTERQGGSDVANGTESIAIPQSDGTYKLYGYKWFSSATDSDIALTLARIPVECGEIVKGTKGISMFYLETKNNDGTLNHIQIIKLKDKLGTRQLPTAELLLDGTVAQRISDEGRGIASISYMLTITRIHNAIGAVSAMRRITSMAREYSQIRKAFGLPIGKFPLHMKVLAQMDLECRGSTLLILELARWLGLEDTKKASEKEQLLMRLITPLAKLFTAKQAMAIISEGLEAFGGQGYIEDTGLPRIFRDAQVLPIWEGTTNIMSLDVLRAISKTKGQVMFAYKDDIFSRLDAASAKPELKEASYAVKRAIGVIESFLQDHQDLLEVAARDFAMSLARSYIGALLIEHAAWSKASKSDVVAANRWCLSNLTYINNIDTYTREAIKDDNDLVMEGYKGLW